MRVSHSFKLNGWRFKEGLHEYVWVYAVHCESILVCVCLSVFVSVISIEE